VKTPATIFEFGGFRLDCDRFSLSRAGRQLKLERKPMELLVLLAAANGRLVTRTEIAQQLWGSEVFVDTEHGINTAVRKIRQVLRDDPEQPRFVQTVTGKGYRFVGSLEKIPGVEFVAPVFAPEVRAGTTQTLPAEVADVAAGPAASPLYRKWPYIAALGALLLMAAGFIFRPRDIRSSGVTYTQLTDFDESAVSPALSPDGKMLAFFRSSGEPFLTSDQIWVKMLPNGEARRLTDDRRWKTGLTFSLDGSQIFYAAVDEKIFKTYAVSVLGGERHLVLDNAAGFSQIGPEQVLFSRIRSGLHMGLVTGTLTNQRFRDLYFPANEGAMVHYSFASPDRTAAIVVEMDERVGMGPWKPCQIVSLNNRFSPRQVGPAGSCTSASWSPDGLWMYFTVAIEGAHHIWRQSYPNGVPQQITFGPAREEGLAMESGGHSLITSLGVRENSIWLRDRNGDRPLATEGEILGWQGGEVEASRPSFTADGRYIYYLARAKAGLQPELWRVEVNSGKSEAVLPGIPMLTFDVSRDGKRVIYSNSARNGTPQIGITALDKSSPARQIPVPGSFQPYFGPGEKILFLQTDKNRNYLEEMNQDGSGRRRVFPFHIVDILGMSPTRRWLLIAREIGDTVPTEFLAVSLKGDAVRTLCTFPCYSMWSPNGKWLFVPVVHASGSDPGRSLAIPIGPDDTLPQLPDGGIKLDSQPSIIQGAQWINRDWFMPGADPSQYAYLKGGVHRNLYRVSLP
jgi:DNA-binding winged helix-turn-helix (wHTH) protein/Tol biopolymer transport system component